MNDVEKAQKIQNNNDKSNAPRSLPRFTAPSSNRC
jgi:hypothetical protein